MSNPRFIDPTAIEIDTDPSHARMTGIAAHGNTPFDVPYISLIADNLWQGGCTTGLVLPPYIEHVVSLYPWERYAFNHELGSELYVKMYDSSSQGYEQLDAIANWINLCRQSGPVLVHCQAGLNRSSLLAARALRLSEGWSGDSIVAHLRDFRSPAVLCNRAFEEKVRSWR